MYVSRLSMLLPPDTLLTRAPGYLLAVESEELDLRCVGGYWVTFTPGE